MSLIKRNYFRKRRDSDTTNNSHFRDDLSSRRGEDAYFVSTKDSSEQAYLKLFLSIEYMNLIFYIGIFREEEG
jgi:hypothetical protein